MAEKKGVSPWLRVTLYVVAILVLPTFVIQFVRPDVLPAGLRNPTLQSVRFKYLLDSGAIFERLQWHNPAISQFQEAERFAALLSDARYESLQEARARLAESLLSAGRPSEAESAYASIVKSSMEAGDALDQKNQFEAAVPKYEDAERFSQKLTAAKFGSLLAAQRSLAGCLVALKRYTELEPVYIRIIATLRDQGDPFDIELGNTYQALAIVRSDLNDFAGAEQAVLQATEVYDQIIEHFSQHYDPAGRDLQAQSQKNFTTWYLAVCYFNEKKMDLALSTAETAFQVLSHRDGPRGVPIGVYTVGLRAATALNRQDQVQLWQRRLNDLTPSHATSPEHSASPQVP